MRRDWSRKSHLWIEESGAESCSVDSFDGLKLHGLFIPSGKSTRTCVVLVHGHMSSSLEMGTYAAMYSHLFDCEILIPDCRGHGKSEGSYAGFGWHDRLDVLAWFEYLRKRLGPGTRFILHGISMGAATVLMTAGENRAPDLVSVVADCGYSSMNEIMRYRGASTLGVFSGLLLPFASLVCRLRAGYFFGQASTLRQAEKSETPTLLIHGESDTYVPTFMMDRIRDRLKGPKETLRIPGAGHALSQAMAPELYTETVRAFLRRYGF